MTAYNLSENALLLEVDDGGNPTRLRFRSDKSAVIRGELSSLGERPVNPSVNDSYVINTPNYSMETTWNGSHWVSHGFCTELASAPTALEFGVGELYEISTNGLHVCNGSAYILLTMDPTVLQPYVDAASASSNSASDSAAAASASASSANNAKLSAESARDAAIIGAGVYIDEPTGRAAVADGVAFKVQGSGDVAAYEYRRVNSGSSDLISVYPSSTGVKSAVGKIAMTLPIDIYGRNPVIVDADNRLIAWLDVSTGNIVIPGVTDTLSVLGNKTEVLQNYPVIDPITGLRPIIVDADNRILVGINTKGEIYIPGISEGYDSILPNDPRILLSDYVGIAERSGNRLRFIRSIVDGQGFQHCSPGSRVGLVTNALSVTFRIYYSNLITRVGPRYSVCGVLVDGVLSASVSNTAGDSSPFETSVTVNFTSSIVRQVELIFPYYETLDLLEIKVSSGAGVGQPLARPSGRLVVCGDSITHGAISSNIFNTWAYKLALLKNMQLINLGYGSRRVVPSDGSAAGNASPTKSTYMIGYNNYYDQTPLATFKADVKSYIANFRAAAGSSVPLYLITPVYSTNTAGAIPLQSYRDQITAAYNELSDPNLHLVDGLTLMTNSADRLNGDGIHPNDTGAAEIASNLASIIV